MPTNIQNANISAAKLGISNVSKIFVGHTEIFPNTFQIQSAAFTDTSTLSAAGGNRTLRIIGDVGATYNLTGDGAGSFTLPLSTYDQTIAISSNGSGPCYSGSNRTITTTLTPTGNTTLQGGGGTFASSFTQDGGTGTTTSSVSISSLTITNTNRVTTTVNGTLYWASGSIFSIAYTAPNSAAVSSYDSLADFGTSYGLNYTQSSPRTVVGSGGSQTWTLTLTAGYVDSVRARVTATANTCYNVNLQNETTSYLYP